jgi:hypothetical protein
MWNIIAKCLQISNLLLEIRLDDAELTSIIWRENCTKTSAFCSSGARISAHVGPNVGHDLESSRYVLQNGITMSIACTSQEI